MREVWDACAARGGGGTGLSQFAQGGLLPRCVCVRVVRRGALLFVAERCRFFCCIIPFDEPAHVTAVLPLPPPAPPVSYAVGGLNESRPGRMWHVAPPKRISEDW